MQNCKELAEMYTRMIRENKVSWGSAKEPMREEERRGKIELIWTD